MTNGSGFTPPAEDQQPPEWAPLRPSAVGVASGLWIALGVLLALGGLWYMGTPAGMTLSTGVVAPLAVCAVGVAVAVCGVRLRRGSSGARTALTVLGALLLIGIWTVLLVVPALVLQYRRSSSTWLDAVARHRAGDVSGP